MWRKRGPCAQLVGMSMCVARMEISMEVPKKKLRTIIRSGNPTSGYIAKENENRI